MMTSLLDAFMSEQSVRDGECTPGNEADEVVADEGTESVQTFPLTTFMSEQINVQGVVLNDK